MKPLLAGTLCATAITFGWLADSALEDEPVKPSPTIPHSTPIQYVEVTTTSSSSTSTTTSTAAPEPIVYPDTPCQEWIPLAVEVGWPADRQLLHRLGEIMWRESRCQTDAHNPNDPNGGSYGLTQINGFWIKWLTHQGVLDGTAQSFYDPAVNLRAALAIHTYSIYKNGSGWHPWRV
jgi:hypothetical protein